MNIKGELLPGDAVKSACFGLAEVVETKGDKVLLKHPIGRTRGGVVLYAQHVDKLDNCEKARPTFDRVMWSLT